MNKVLLIIGAAVHLFFGLFHVALWQAFSQPSALSGLDAGSRATFLTLNLAVTVTCLIFAYLSLFHRNEILSTRLGSGLLATIGAFWIVRALAEVIFYGTSAPGAPITVAIWLLISLLYFVPLLRGRQVSVAPVAQKPTRSEA